MPVPPYVLASLPRLAKISKLGPKKGQQLFSAIFGRDNNCYRAVISFAKNAVFNESLSLSAASKKKLSPNRNQYLKLASRKLTYQQKVSLIRRKGYMFVPQLVSVMVPVVQNVVGGRKSV